MGKWLTEQSRQINTLTGKVSRLNVVLQGEERIQIGVRQVRARRYHLGGELEGTLSWYDEQGCWLALLRRLPYRLYFRWVKKGTGF